MMRPILIVVGCVATALALLGAVLPGLPTVPFLLVALWAFARSSPRLYRWLHAVPVLRQALAAAHRFEERRALRPGIKALAVGMAWTSVVGTWAVAGFDRPILLGAVAAAAVAATLAMIVIPTDRG